MSTLPFTYPWLIKNRINKTKVKTILELGCGRGDFADLVNDELSYKITGIDIFQSYLNLCKKKGKYEKVIKRDLTKRLPFKDNSFDAVVCLQTVEHLNKKAGLFLISEMERIAKRMILISIPKGECAQEEYDNNKYQRHLSQWTSQELTKMKYRVNGTGLQLIYGKYSHAGDKVDLLKLPLYFISFLMNPVAYIYPLIAAQLVAVKMK